MPTRTTKILAACLAMLTFALAGAARAASTPEQAVTEYFAALKKDGMSAAAGFIHPDELSRFKDMLLPIFRREAAGEDHPLADALFGKGTTLAQVEAISGADFMNALLRVIGEKFTDVAMGDAEVLGLVREKDIVHVVARISAQVSDGVKIKTLEVVSTRAYGKDWKLLLTGELEGLAAALASQ